MSLRDKIAEEVNEILHKELLCTTCKTCNLYNQAVIIADRLAGKLCLDEVRAKETIVKYFGHTKVYPTQLANCIATTNGIITMREDEG